VERRAATTAEIDMVASTIRLAFSTDPIWGPALSRPDGATDHLEPYWRLFVADAVEHRSAFLVDEGAAVSIWIVPGGDELSPARLGALEALLARSLAPDDNAAIHALYGRFEASRAPLPDHWYLSLLATHPDHRGRGVGQALLAADLAAWDQAGVPAYLESTNPANDHRYARAGFRPIGGFVAVKDDARVTAMWRDIGGSAIPA
jgi:GNAT superfamily N-acetyltransferase